MWDGAFENLFVNSPGKEWSITVIFKVGVQTLQDQGVVESQGLKGEMQV